MLGEIVGHPYPGGGGGRLILTGGTIYHYMSGYGGGRKSAWMWPCVNAFTSTAGVALKQLEFNAKGLFIWSPVRKTQRP